MVSFRHHACVNKIEQAGDVSKVRDFDGCYNLSDDVNQNDERNGGTKKKKREMHARKIN